jgi:hypothetical protein
MSKIGKYDRFMYASIRTALREMMRPYRIDNPLAPVEVTYNSEAYDEVVAFLCMNDIPHTITEYPIIRRLKARMIIVSWTEQDEHQENIGWWENWGAI